MGEEFTPITSQEQLDQIIGERVKREKEASAKKYADYNDLKTKSADYEKQLADLTKSLDDANGKMAAYEKEREELNGKISAYETHSVKLRIAREAGIPYELADRLSGGSEDEIREDAKNFSQYVGRAGSPPPLADTEPPVETDKAKAAIKRMVAGINNK